jgi:hypothetical protein
MNSSLYRVEYDVVADIVPCRPEHVHKGVYVGALAGREPLGRHHHRGRALRLELWLGRLEEGDQLLGHGLVVLLRYQRQAELHRAAFDRNVRVLEFREVIELSAFANN